MEPGTIYIRVGSTRSGKIILYSSSINDLSSIIKCFEETCFSSDDLLDAFAVFDYLALRGMRRGDEVVIYERHAETIQNILDSRELIEARKRAKIRSAFDLRDLGKSLAAVEFADF